jgi:hypothetical protein
MSGERHELVALLLATRFQSKGLAGSAAETVTAHTGEPHRWAFRPGRHPDATPFIIEKVKTHGA